MRKLLSLKRKPADVSSNSQTQSGSVKKPRLDTHLSEINEETRRILQKLLVRDLPKTLPPLPASQLVDQDTGSTAVLSEAEQDDVEISSDRLIWTPLPSANYDLLTKKPPSFLTLEQLCALAPVPLATEHSCSLPLSHKTRGTSVPQRSGGNAMQLCALAPVPLATEHSDSLPLSHKAGGTSVPQRSVSGISSNTKQFGSRGYVGATRSVDTVASRMFESVVSSHQEPLRIEANSSTSCEFGLPSTSRTNRLNPSSSGLNPSTSGLNPSSSGLNASNSRVESKPELNEPSSVLDGLTELDLSNFSDFDDDQAETDTNPIRDEENVNVNNLASEEGLHPDIISIASNSTVVYGSDLDLFDDMQLEQIGDTGEHIQPQSEDCPHTGIIAARTDHEVAVGDCIDQVDVSDHDDYHDIDVDLFMRDSSTSSSDSDLPKIDFTGVAVKHQEQPNQSRSPWKPVSYSHSLTSSNLKHKRELQYGSQKNPTVLTFSATHPNPPSSLSLRFSEQKERKDPSATHTPRTSLWEDKETSTLSPHTAGASSLVRTSFSQTKREETLHHHLAGASVWETGNENSTLHPHTAGASVWEKEKDTSTLHPHSAGASVWETETHALATSSCPVCSYVYPTFFTQLQADEHMAVCIVADDDW